MTDDPRDDGPAGPQRPSAGAAQACQPASGFPSSCCGGSYGEAAGHDSYGEAGYGYGVGWEGRWRGGGEAQDWSQHEEKARQESTNGAAVSAAWKRRVDVEFCVRTALEFHEGVRCSCVCVSVF